MFFEESSKSLESYIKNNIFEISAFFESTYKEIAEYRWTIDDWCITNEDALIKLNYEEYYNSLFVLSLLEFAEKFSLRGSYNVLYNISLKNKLNIGHRQKAAKLFLLDINLKEDYLKLFDDILENLQKSYETEEDNEIKVLQTFGNYFLNTVKATSDVDITIIERIITKIKLSRNNISLLSFDLIDKLISIVPNNTHLYLNDIQEVVKQPYLKTKQRIPFVPNYTIEQETKYVDLLKNAVTSFNSIRGISMEIFNSYSFEKKVSLREELLRGVKIIDKEELLYAYMTLYGRKHQKKLNYTFSKIQNLPNNYNLIDWACGQGLASMLLIDKYGINNCKKIILNEPSTLSLQRASLHLKKYSDKLEIIIINKMIEEIADNDIIINTKIPTIHLFSNILDIDINRQHVSQLIEQNCRGLNYFICVSPYIDDIRTNRIDLFMNYFVSKHNADIIQNTDIKNNDPTMVIRVFKAVL